MPNRAFEQMGQKRLGHVNNTIQIHIQDALNGIKVQIFEANKGLNNSGVIDKTIHGPMSADDLIGQGVDGLMVSHIHHVGTDVSLMWPRKLNSFLEGLFVKIDSCNSRAHIDKFED